MSNKYRQDANLRNGIRQYLCFYNPGERFNLTI
jgi:hypothetical protein